MSKFIRFLKFLAVPVVVATWGANCATSVLYFMFSPFVLWRAVWVGTNAAITALYFAWRAFEKHDAKALQTAAEAVKSKLLAERYNMPNVDVFRVTASPNYLPTGFHKELQKKFNFTDEQLTQIFGPP